MNPLFQPFCYVLNTLLISRSMIALTVAIILAVGIIAWMTDLGGRGFPLTTFLVVAMGIGILLGIPAILTGMGVDIPCMAPTN